MIVKIDTDVFLSEDDNIQRNLSGIIRNALKKRFLWDTDDIYAVYDLVESTSWFKFHLSKQEQNDFKETIQKIEALSAYITLLHRKYLTTIEIGFKENQINPAYGEFLLNQPSNVILENRINDFKFIKGLIEKYRNHRERKTIYSLLSEAVGNNWLIADNAGGKGQIKKLVLDWIERNGKLYKIKLATVFDSDRSNIDDLPNEQKILIKFLKMQDENSDTEEYNYSEEDRVVWHMLEKRESENYLPIDVINTNYPKEENTCKNLRLKTPNELDYVDHEKEFIDIDVKNEFPQLFLDTRFRRDVFEERCAHQMMDIELPNSTLQQVSELEFILLKLVKII